MSTNTKRTSRDGKFQPLGRWIRPEKRLAIYLRDEFTCIYCGCDLHGAHPNQITLDHVRPVSAGGSNSEHNLVTACRRCNCSRGNKPIAEFCDTKTKLQILKHTDRSLKRYRRLADAIISGQVNPNDK